MSGNLGLDCNFIVIIFRAGYIITINTANSSMVKRKCNDSYIKFEFTSLNDQEIAKRQCVVCYRVLSNESLRSSKLSHHLNTSHPELKDGNMKYFERLESNCKRQRLDSTDSFQQTDQKLSEASFVVSQTIARQKKLIILVKLLLSLVHEPLQELYWARSMRRDFKVFLYLITQ